MAKTILQTTTVLVNGVDLSDHAQSVNVEGTGTEVDVTSMGGNGYTETLVGLKDASITVNWFQDFAAGEVHATLNALWASNTPFVVEVKPTNAAISATNPACRLTQAIMPNYSPINGAVGDASQTETVFRNAPGGILEFDVTP
jgi:hypothetical protein